MDVERNPENKKEEKHSMLGFLKHKEEKEEEKFQEIKKRFNTNDSGKPADEVAENLQKELDGVDFTVKPFETDMDNCEDIQPPEAEEKEWEQYVEHNDVWVRKGNPNNIVKRPPRCGWNWGAYMFGWIYGIFNRSWICLITLISPILSWLFNRPYPMLLSIIFCVICGFLGEQMSYNHYIYDSVPFDVKKWKKAQRIWNAVGEILMVITLCLAIFYCGMLLGAHQTDIMWRQALTSALLW